MIGPFPSNLEIENKRLQAERSLETPEQGRYLTQFLDISLTPLYFQSEIYATSEVVAENNTVRTEEWWWLGGV